MLLEQGRLAPYERARAGAALASLPGGDPRPGVHQVAPLLCQVVASRFWQGEGEHARLVQVDTFWISRYPVTNAQYAFFVKATGHRPPVHWKGDRFPVEMGNHPVVSVTWQDAVDFCQWLSGELRARGVFVWQQGRVERMERLPVNCRVRLPADVEWEKAARGGLLVPVSQGMGLVDNPMPRRAYPWGEAWHSSVEGEERGETRCNVSESGIGTTTPVGMYPTGASPYGVMDMAGNAWEWCLDWTDSTHRYKSRRGGAFRYTHEHAHCSAGDRAHPSLGWPYQGFRVVFGPPVEKR